MLSRRLSQRSYSILCWVIFQVELRVEDNVGRPTYHTPKTCVAAAACRDMRSRRGDDPFGPRARLRISDGRSALLVATAIQGRILVGPTATPTARGPWFVRPLMTSSVRATCLVLRTSRSSVQSQVTRHCSHISVGKTSESIESGYIAGRNNLIWMHPESCAKHGKNNCPGLSFDLFHPHPLNHWRNSMHLAPRRFPDDKYIAFSQYCFYHFDVRGADEVINP
jgi:hypothetical protein